MSDIRYFEILLILWIFLVTFLYKSSHVFRYYFKFLFAGGSIMSLAVILMPVFALRVQNVRNMVIASYFCRLVSPLLGLKWILKGKEHLEKERSCIIVANHQSSLDVLGMFDVWSVMDKCTVIAKNSIMYTGPFGLAAWLSGLIFIPRVNLEKAKVLMNEAAEHIKLSKTKLWIFPEGTRRNTGQIHPFKKGAFHLAITSQLPILPVVYSRYYFLDGKAKKFDQGKIIMTTLPPIETKGKTLDDIDDLMRHVRDLMTATFHESTKEAIENN